MNNKNTTVKITVPPSGQFVFDRSSRSSLFVVDRSSYSTIPSSGDQLIKNRTVTTAPDGRVFCDGVSATLTGIM